MKTYYFSKIKSGYSNSHALTRLEFDSPTVNCPSVEEGDLIIVRTHVAPKKAQPLDCVLVEPKVWAAGEEVDLLTKVAFDNRHREKRVPAKLGPAAAMQQFCRLSGLEAGLANAFAHFLGPVKVEKFNIHNAFLIKGRFKIHDPTLFTKAYLHGLGSRRSYGFGLIRLI